MPIVYLVLNTGQQRFAFPDDTDDIATLNKIKFI